MTMVIRLLLGGLFASVLAMLLTKETHVSCISPVGVMGAHQQVGELGLTDSDDSVICCSSINSYSV